MFSFIIKIQLITFWRDLSIKKMVTLEELLNKKVIIPGAEPFFLRDQTSNIGVLMLHGLTDSPKIMSGLAKLLYDQSDKKIASLAPLFTGHGTTIEDLKNAKKEQWYEDSVLAFEKLRERYDNIFLIGFSMGANLCYLLTEEFREENKIKGIVSISGAFDLKTKLKSGAKVLSLFKDYLEKNRKEEKEKGGNLYWAGYQSYPLNAVKELISLGNQTKKVASKIHVPCLLFQGKGDNLLKKNCAKNMYEKLENVTDKELVIMDARHLLPTYKETLPELSKKIYEFIHKTICPMQ